MWDDYPDGCSPYDEHFNPGAYEDWYRSIRDKDEWDDEWRYDADREDSLWEEEEWPE